MSDRRMSLLECIEQAASSASRDTRARENAVEDDEMDDDRSETVGAAIKGAAASTTNQGTRPARTRRRFQHDKFVLPVCAERRV